MTACCRVYEYSFQAVCLGQGSAPDPTNSVIALKDEDGRSIAPGPHHHVTIIQHTICSVQCNRKEAMQTHLITVGGPSETKSNH